MTIRTPLLLAATASAILAAVPALAQPVDDPYYEDDYAYDDAYYEDEYGNQLQSGDYRGTWQGQWDDAETWRGSWDGTYTDVEGYTVDASYDGVWIDDARFVSDAGPVLHRDGERGWYENYDSAPGARRVIRRDIARYGADDYGTPRLGYSAAQREEWLQQCRALRREELRYVDYDDRYYYDGDRRSTSPAMATSVIGAVAGGVAGNRIAGRGDRLAGTLIGAGVGGLAGAVIGGLIDSVTGGRDEDEYYYEEEFAYADDEYGFGYCDAYLLNYERGHALPMQGHAMQVAYAPVVMAPAPAPLIQRAMPARHRVVEERIIVEPEEVAAPAPRYIRRVVVQPRPSAGKLQPIK